MLVTSTTPYHPPTRDHFYIIDYVHEICVCCILHIFVVDLQQLSLAIVQSLLMSPSNVTRALFVVFREA